jgi:P4 family phage/plasmid primase-like protien
MMKIKFVKDTAQYKIGDIVSLSDTEAEEIISSGFAEKVETIIQSIWRKKELEDTKNDTIYIAKEDYDRLKKEHGGVNIDDIIEKKIKYYNLKPFNSSEKVIYIQKIKDYIILKNPHYKEPEKKPKEKDLEIEDYDEISGEDYPIRSQVLKWLALKKKGKATELLVEHILGNHHIYTTKDDLKSEMWVYKNGVYVPQGKSEVKEIVRKIIGDVFTTNFYNEVISKIEADTYIEQETFFKTNYLHEIPVLNGILNIFTLELKPFDPKKIFFNKLPIKYNPEAKCPNILQHFKTILKSEDDTLVMLELFGYLLFKEYKIEQAFMFVGKGRNGKSKTLELMKRFVGVENCASIALKSMNEESFDVWELFGKMVNLAGDLSKTDLKETGTIKMLVGRDTISARRKFLNIVKFVNYAKMVFAANELPKVYDMSDGFWSKWVVLEFPYQFVTEEIYNNLSDEEKVDKKIMDPDIMDKLSTEEELSGLLNESLVALNRLLHNRQFSYSQGTSEIKNMWVRKADSFAAFCMDCIEDDYGYYIPKSVLRKVFNIYCKKYKLKGVSDKSLKATLEEEFGVSEARRTVNNEFINCWDGIKFSIRGIKDIIPIHTLYKIFNFVEGIKTGDMSDTLDSYKSVNINDYFRIKSYNPDEQ